MLRLLMLAPLLAESLPRNLRRSVNHLGESVTFDPLAVPENSFLQIDSYGSLGELEVAKPQKKGAVKPTDLADSTTHPQHTVLPYDGAPDCKITNDEYGCATTLDEQKAVKKHLNRRGIVAFSITTGLAFVIWVLKSIFTFFRNKVQDTKYVNAMFIKGMEQITILGVLVCLSILIEQYDTFWELDRLFFPDKDRGAFDLSKYASGDKREGVIHPEILQMFFDMHLLVASLMFVYTGFMCILGLHFAIRFRKWHRFEIEAENEVHVMDDPLEKVSFLLWRRSLLTPMLGQRSEELNQLRSPLQEFSFTNYMQEVLAQYVNHLFHIPTAGLVIMIITAGLECFLEMQTRSQASSISGLSLTIWTWTLIAIISIFYVHVVRIKRLLTAPPAALLWHLEHNEDDSPEKYLLPPFRLIPYLKEAPKKTKFFYWWYGTFSPNQQEQLFFRWRKGPSTILYVLQICIFVLAVFFTVLVRHCIYSSSTGMTNHFWYPLAITLGVALGIFWIIPETTLTLLVCSATGLMVNKRAMRSTIKEHAEEHTELAVQLLEMAQVSAMKEQMENPATMAQYNSFLLDLYDVIFTEDEKELFEAGWRIHNWNQSRGMNPGELKECMEHLGFDDSEMIIGEWWLVFDNSGTGSLEYLDFKRMLVARHMIKYGFINESDLVRLLEVHPNGDTIHQYNRALLSDYLISFRVPEPRLGALILIREARFMADQKAGKSDQHIRAQMDDIEHCLASPQEVAAFLVTKQSYRIKFDQNYIQQGRLKKDRANAAAGTSQVD